MQSIWNMPPPLWHLLPSVLKKCPKRSNLNSFIQSGTKMRKINRPWPNSNQFWRRSGYISMPNCRPILPCILKRRPQKPQIWLVSQESNGAKMRRRGLSAYIARWLLELKVKSLFWVHIQAQNSALQTLTSTFPGHWAFTVHISIWIFISTPWGVYSCSHATWRHGLQICLHRYPFPPGSREAMQREVPCSGTQRAVAPAGYWTRDLT